MQQSDVIIVSKTGQPQALETLTTIINNFAGVLCVILQ